MGGSWLDGGTGVWVRFELAAQQCLAGSIGLGQVAQEVVVAGPRPSFRLSPCLWVGLHGLKVHPAVPSDLSYEIRDDTLPR